jgi:hypothetical protein
VDINIAAPKVLKARAGVALMADPERAEAMVRATVQAVRVPVAVKIRSGWRDRGEGAVALAQRLEGAGAAMVTVHPRWARQGFLGEADWSVIAAVKQAVSIPVIGNGDVRHGVTRRDDGAPMRRGDDWPRLLGNPAVARRGGVCGGLPSADGGGADGSSRRHLSLVIADRAR